MRPWIPSSSISASFVVAASSVAVAGRHELLVLGMPLDVVREERAERDDVDALPPRVLERGGCEPAAEAATLARFVDLRVREGDAALPAAVGREPDQPPVQPELVPARPRDVRYLGVG